MKLTSANIMEVVRFGVVGVIATLIHYGIYLLLNQFIINWVAYSIGYAISFICNFFLSNFFTFKTKPSFKKGIGFGASHVINYLLHVILLSVFIKLGVNEDLAPIPVFCIVIPINFLLVRFVLKSGKDSQSK